MFRSTESAPGGYPRGHTRDTRVPPCRKSLGDLARGKRPPPHAGDAPSSRPSSTAPNVGLQRCIPHAEAGAEEGEGHRSAGLGGVPRRQLLARLAPLNARVAPLWLCLLVAGCATMGKTAAVSLTMKRTPDTPNDATVTIDEEYVGPLYYVQAKGVRIPVGEHRITVEKAGYFPYDELIVADRKPIHLQVRLVPVPD